MPKQDRWVGEGQGLSKRVRGLLTAHAFVSVLLGLFGGFAWLIVLAGALEFWPLPPIEMPVPDVKEAWRNAHVGPIVNGLFAMGIIALSPICSFGVTQAKWIYYSVILMLYGNAIGYGTAPFTSTRGARPINEPLNQFCYFSFYIAAIAAFVIIGLFIFCALKAAREN